MTERPESQPEDHSRTAPPPPAQFIIAVGSGKGGVGKSTVSLNLALALVEGGAKVGLLDADLYGPNIPLMVGLVRRTWGTDWTLARNREGGAQPKIPTIERYGLQIMSAGFLIGEDQPLADASLVRLLAHQFIWLVDWGKLDYLIVDLPPGTADFQQVMVQAVPFSGAILVVTPQDVAHLDARKAVQMYQRAGVNILGGVENMSGFICPDCGNRHDLFSRVPESRSIWAMGVDRLGDVPMDPLVSQSGDTGRPIVATYPKSPQAEAFRQIARRLGEKLDNLGTN